MLPTLQAAFLRPTRAWEGVICPQCPLIPLWIRAWDPLDSLDRVAGGYENRTDRPTDRPIPNVRLTVPYHAAWLPATCALAAGCLSTKHQVARPAGRSDSEEHFN